MPTNKDDLLRSIQRYSRQAALSTSDVGAPIVPYLDERGIEREGRLREDAYLEGQCVDYRRKLAIYGGHALADIRRNTMAIRTEAALSDDQVLQSIPSDLYPHAHDKVSKFQDDYDSLIFEPSLMSLYQISARSISSAIEHLQLPSRIEPPKPEPPKAFFQSLWETLVWNKP